MREADYYDQSQLWHQQPEGYQLQDRADVLDILPADAGSVLDVGCGDGFITNALPAQLRVIGLDLSPQALGHVVRPRLAGSITALPFPDAAFDLILTSDVLEHMPAALYRTALAELARVAAKYILVVVPHAEQLESNFARCTDCGRVYHVNWHQRRFREDDLFGLLPEPWQPIEIRLTGDDTLPPPDPTVGLRHELGLFRTWAQALCPECGSRNQATGDPEGPVARALDSLRSQRWAHALAATGGRYPWPNRTELLALFARDGAPRKVPAPPSTVQGDLLEIDFSNPLQAVRGDFVPGSAWARYRVPEGSVHSEGLAPGPQAPDPLVVHARFPVVPAVGDRLTLTACGSGGSVTLYAHDNLVGRQNLIGEWNLQRAETPQCFTIHQPCAPNRFGAAIELHLSGPVRLQRLAWAKADRSSHPAPFVDLSAGHHVLASSAGEYVRSWGFMADRPGRYPAPRLEPAQPPEFAEATWRELLELLQAANRQLAAVTQSLSSLCDDIESRRLLSEQSSAGLQQRVQELEALRESIENRYLTTDSALVQTRAMLRQLHRRRVLTGRRLRNTSEQLELTECHREQAEQAYARAEQAFADARQQMQLLQHELARRSGIKGGLKEIARTIKRRTVGPALPVPRPVFLPPWRRLEQAPPAEPGGLRVLVCSHMYPHPDQPSSGPFIHEQVAALRRFAGVDARVLVGRPFWMRNRNPFKLAKADQCWRRFHDECVWHELDGVPVKYVPYEVFSRFMSHGWAYRRAITRNIAALHREFPFQLVHAHTAYLDGSGARALSRRYDVPMLITEHTGPFSILTRNPLIKLQTQAAIRQASRVVAVSNAQRRSIAAEISAGLHDRLTVLPNVTDIELFRPPARRTFDSQRPRILFVGYFVAIKQLPLLLEAFVRVQAAIRGATLRLVGGGETPEQEQELRDRVAALNLGGSVEVFGYHPRQALADMMREWCDLLVLPSRAETFGCVVTEAMACGKPVVATRCGGPEDIITNPQVGRLCDNGDPAALAAAILEIAGHLEAFPPEPIRRHVEEHFSAAAVARSIAELYDAILGSTGQSRPTAALAGVSPR